MMMAANQSGFFLVTVQMEAVAIATENTVTDRPMWRPRTAASSRFFSKSFAVLKLLVLSSIK